MKKRLAARIGAGLMGAVVVAAPVLAAAPSAIVEAVVGSPAGVAALDYLSPGRTITLGKSEGLVLDYLRSCRREIITGGTVTIGASDSQVQGGSVERERVECDGGPRRMPADDKGFSFGTPAKPRGQPTEMGIERTLYGDSPLIDMGGPGRLTVERIDKPGEKIALDLTASQLIHGRFYDFAKAGRKLTPGGLYRASAGDRGVVFWIDPLARGGETPLAGRLLQL
jgi:hypothetical protein